MRPQSSISIPCSRAVSHRPVFAARVPLWFPRHAAFFTRSLQHDGRRADIDLAIIALTSCLVRPRNSCLSPSIVIMSAYHPFTMAVHRWPRQCLCAHRPVKSRLPTHPHHLRNTPSSSPLPHASPKPFGLLIPQLPANFQQCLGRLQKAYKERSSCTSTCRPAPGLQLSQCHSSCHSPPIPPIPAVPGRRRKAHKMARPNRESLVLVIRNSWRGCQLGMPQRINPSEIHSFISIF